MTLLVESQPASFLETQGSHPRNGHVMPREKNKHVTTHQAEEAAPGDPEKVVLLGRLCRVSGNLNGGLIMIHTWVIHDPVWLMMVFILFVDTLRIFSDCFSLIRVDDV